MLDKEGVRVASGSYNDEAQRKGQLERIHPLFLEFILKGGKVIASKTWVDDYGLASEGSWAPSVKLLTDDEMADEYFKRKGEILDY